MLVEKLGSNFPERCAVKLFAIMWLLLAAACAIQKPNSLKRPAPAHAEKLVAPHRSALQISKLRRQENYFIKSKGGRIALADPVKKIALAIQAQKLEFDGRPLTDCSGIFHRFLRAVEKEYPEFEYPPVPPGKYRTTRGMARWYHERSELYLIKEKDVFAYDGLIKPGAVLFYGYQNRRYKRFSAQDLFVHGTGINHMGVVVDVVRDNAGNVLTYTLFHGHGRRARPAKPGTYASITNWHRRKPTRNTYTPFGNGTQQWIAVARLLPYSP